MKLIGNVNTVVKETDCFAVFSCKFDPLCISQMSYFISLYIFLYKAESYICLRSLGFLSFCACFNFCKKMVAFAYAQLGFQSTKLSSEANSPHPILWQISCLLAFSSFFFPQNPTQGCDTKKKVGVLSWVSPFFLK